PWLAGQTKVVYCSLRSHPTHHPKLGSDRFSLGYVMAEIEGSPDEVQPVPTTLIMQGIQRLKLPRLAIAER
ncbi:MAG: hypothetical protein QNJ72_39145, partial [Pleurocapsa sp. MO_226.B13]|nr:hypothetical protein [Pleurocapsa sp. MO_226.B13]